MLLQTLVALQMIEPLEKGKTIGLVTFDVTLIFQVINTLIMLLFFIGVPYLIFRMFKSSQRKTKEIELLNNKIDALAEKLES